jgi:hypothetical protein
MSSQVQEWLWVVGRLPATLQNENNVIHMQEIVHSDCHHTVEMIAEKVKMSFSISPIIPSKDLKVLCPHIVPRMRTLEQHERRVRISGELINTA